LHCKNSEEAKRLVKEKLPRVLSQYPQIIRALCLAAGARIPLIAREGQMALPFKAVSEERRISLIQKFQEDFSALLQILEPFEVGVEFTGTIYGVVLLDLVRRYFRGRFLVEPCFPRIVPEPVEGFNVYREQIRAFYGLDPLEGPEIDDVGQYGEALATEARERGWRALVRPLEKDPLIDLASVFESQEIEVLPFLTAWTMDDVRSYADIQNLELLPSLLDLSQKPEGRDVEDGNWTRDARGMYRLNGRLVKQDTVPEEVRMNFEAQDTVPEEDAGGSDGSNSEEA
jgi:hypothetical protein